MKPAVVSQRSLLASPAARRGPLPLAAWLAAAALTAVVLRPLARNFGVNATGVMTLAFVLAAALYAARRRSVLVSLYLIRPFVVFRPLQRFQQFAVRLDQLQHWRTLHLGLGLLALVPFSWHVTAARGGLIEQALLIMILLVVLTGVIGVGLQYAMPNAMLRLVEREVRVRDVEERRRALFVLAEERILGRSDALVDSYLRLLRPVLQGDTRWWRLLAATLRGEELGADVRREVQRMPLARDDALLLSELFDLAEQKLRLDLNLFHLAVTTAWLTLHAAAVSCALALTGFHIATVLYFGGL